MAQLEKKSMSGKLETGNDGEEKVYLAALEKKIRNDWTEKLMREEKTHDELKTYECTLVI